MIQTLEVMLRAYMFDFQGSWVKHIALVEFAYNTSIRMALYEIFYGRKCRSPSHLYKVGEGKLLGTKLCNRPGN